LLFTAAGFAETHRFQPTQLHNTFPSPHSPVLRIKLGDHVITSTIDAGGTDSAGERRARGPNPMDYNGMDAVLPVFEPGSATLSGRRPRAPGRR
jgi:hypothetical protein